MLSPHKKLLLLLAFAALVGAVLPVVLAASVQMPWLPAEGVRPFLGPTLALAAASFAPAIALQIEFAQALRGTDFELLREETLSFSQLKQQLAWCPAPLVVTSLSLGLLCIALCMLGGFPTWSSEQPLTQPVARAIMLFTAPFSLFPLPFLVSAYRAPGSFASLVGPNENAA